MSRLEGKCPGDCTKCQLLEDGRVTMEVCMLDQVFQRVQKQEKNIDRILTLLEVKEPEMKPVSLVREVEPADTNTEEAEL